MSELTANKTFYVRTDGIDTNNGLTSGNAFLTLQRAADETRKWRTGEFTLTVDIGKGSFPLYSSLDPAHLDGPNILWKGVVTDLDPEGITSYQGNPMDPNQYGVWYGELLSEIPELSGHFSANLAALHVAILIKGATGGTGTVFLNGINQCYLWHENSDTLHWMYPYDTSGFNGRPTLPYTFAQFKLIETEIILMGTDGIVSSSGGHCGCWDGISLLGDHYTDYAGVCMSNRSTIVFGPDFGIYRCAPALLCQSNGVIYADGSYHAAANSIHSPLVLAESGGFISVRDSILKATAREAVLARDNGTVDLQGAVLYCAGDTHSVKATRCGSINAANCTVLGCASTGSVAFYMDTEGYIDSTDATDDAETSRSTVNPVVEASGVKLLDANKALYIRTDGNDSNGGYSSGDAFLTPERVIDELNKWKTNGHVLQVDIGEGTFSLGSPLDPAHPGGTDTNWTGVATAYTSRTINNIDGSPSYLSAGLEYIDFDVSLPAASGAAVGQYILVKTTSGGTNPNLVKGCHEIITWNGTTNVATVRCVRCASVTLMPSGTITASTLTLVKTIFHFTGSHGILSSDGHCGFWNSMVVKGSGAYNGVYMLGAGTISLGSNFATSEWNQNLHALNGGRIFADTTTHSYSNAYLGTAGMGALLSLYNGAILSGCKTTALRALDNGVVNFRNSEAYCGGTAIVIYAYKAGHISAVDSIIEGCVPIISRAFFVSSGAGIDSSGAVDDAVWSRGQGEEPDGNGSYHVY